MVLYEDITYADSMDGEFLMLPDGSYVLLNGGQSSVRREVCCVADGVLRQICGTVSRWNHRSTVV
ncbi:MAG: hypothetical protein E7445_03540 [Ruminococcaceae bacterium]|nr:hypothetical protein [Oscillospiraceae bacterium]